MLIFFITFFISFVGSIHPGPLNLSVIQTTLQKGLYPALLLALGGIIPEIIYGYLAVEGVIIFERHPTVFNAMTWATIPILFVLGVQQIITTRKPKPLRRTSTHHQGTSKGFLLSITNPQLLPYWIVVLVSYQNYEFLTVRDFFDKIFFVLGASSGAFALNYFYAYLADRQREKIFGYINQNRFEQIIGWTFIGMGLLQLIKLVR